MKLVYLKKNLTRFDAYERKKKLYVNLRYDFANSNAPYKIRIYNHKNRT